jgi:hypothetical protein
MKARNLDKNWIELYHSTRTNPIAVFSDGILWRYREKCWGAYHPIYEVEERLELKSVALATAAVHSYLHEVFEMEEDNDDHDYEHIV